MKAKHLTWIRADGTVEVKSSSDDLLTLQKMVGGYIETIPYFGSYNGRKCVAFANDSGRIDGLPLNHVATNAWHSCQSLLADPLHGDIVIVQKEQS